MLFYKFSSDNKCHSCESSGKNIKSNFLIFPLGKHETTGLRGKAMNLVSAKIQIMSIYFDRAEWKTENAYTKDLVEHGSLSLKVKISFHVFFSIF